jgi:hypothetical protein
MADKTVTIPAPTATSTGVVIQLVNVEGGRLIHVQYSRPDGGFDQYGLTAAEYAALPQTFRDKIDALFAVVVPRAAAKMGY